MNVEVVRLPESRVTLKVELSPQEVDQALDRTYKRLLQRVNIPGFRKGKAPRSVVERVIGPEVYLHEATDEAVQWGYRKAVDDSNLTPIDQAEVQAGDSEHEHVQPGAPFRFEARVAVKPEVQLPDYHTIRVTPPAVEVSDGDIDQLLREIRERTATLEPTIRAAQIGDVVTMTMLGKVDGEEVINEENGDFELRDEEEEGPNPVFPGLSKELEGVNRGDIREITLHLSEMYPNQALAGKTMFLRILVKEIKRKVLPDLDDELAQSVSSHQTLEELRDNLRANLMEERKQEADEKLVAEAVESVTSRSFVEIPPILIEEELDRILRDMRRAFELRHLSFEQYLESQQKSEAQIRGESIEDATQNVKTSLVLGAIGDQENIQVSNREVDQALEEMVRTIATNESDRRRLRSSTAVRSNIRSRLRRQRTIQKLVEIVTGGKEVSSEATEAVADQTAAVAEDTQETVAVEIGG